MHLLATEAGLIAKAAVGVLGALRLGAPGIDAEGARRLDDSVSGRLKAEGDKIGIEAYELFSQDPAEYRVPLLIVLANKANQDANYRTHLQELVVAAGGMPG